MTSDEKDDEIVLRGIAASPGIAHGRALVYLQSQVDVPRYDLADSAVDGEIERFEKALINTRLEIAEVREIVAGKLGEGEARIFDAHLMVLEDNALLEEVVSEVRSSKINVEFCFNKVAQRYISFFQSMEDDYLKERVSDIQDVSRRLLHNLVGKSHTGLGDLAMDSIVVSEDLTPSDTADLDRNKLLGFITDAGGKTSHTVIMARSLRIPAVVGLHDATGKIRTGDDVLVDGHEGIVVINPSDSRLYQYGQLATKRRELDRIFRESLDEPSETKDGTRVDLMANIEGAHEIERVLEMRADGVGLFRTEGIFLRNHGYPPESTQFDEYSAVAKAAGDNPVIIRTLDVGGDKTVGAHGINEDNSFMGFRAIRFCLGNNDIFRTQLRAILRASAHGNVKLMYPMISGLDELRRANEVLGSVKEELRGQGEAFNEGIEVGAMVEVPSAATIIDLLAAECDFLSIGTNDLIQYLLAVDRLNDRVAHLYEPTHPAVLRTLKQIIEGGNLAKTPVSICGEIAGDPVFASLLVGLGASSLSLVPSMLPEVKYFVRRIDVETAQNLVSEVMQIEDAREILHRLSVFMEDTIGSLV